MTLAKKVAFLILLTVSFSVNAQQYFNLKFKNSLVYSGIEVGSKGVKMSILEIAKGSQRASSFNILKDTSVNSDFISFTSESFKATLNAVEGFCRLSIDIYGIPSERIFTMFSSGVKIQSDKAERSHWLGILADSLRTRLGEPGRRMEPINVIDEARLSHLGIIPAAKRFNTFLIDIGSGNTKGGYFPNGNTRDFKLFELTWGTKSIANETEKRMDNDRTMQNYLRQLKRVLAAQPEEEIVYAVNASGAYNYNDNIAFSGGIAWASATLMFPQLYDNPVIPVTYDELAGFIEKVASDYGSFSPENATAAARASGSEKSAMAGEIRKVNAVFNQQALLAGAGLLLKIMRQFEGIYEKKQFFLIKNGQVGWISAFVDQSLPMP